MAGAAAAIGAQDGARAKITTAVGALRHHRTDPLTAGAEALAARRCIVTGCELPVGTVLSVATVPVGPVCLVHEETIMAALRDELVRTGRATEGLEGFARWQADRDRREELRNRRPNRATRRAQARARRRARGGPDA